MLRPAWRCGKLHPRLRGSAALEVTVDNGAEGSVWPISSLKEIPTLKIVGKRRSPATKPAVDDAADEGLVRGRGTRGPGKWSKRRQGNVGALQLGESEI